MKKLNIILSLCVVVLSNQSCNEESHENLPKTIVTDPAIHVQVEETSLIDYYPFFYEKIDREYELYGQIAYRQLKYNLAEDASELLASYQRIDFKNAYNRIAQDYGGLNPIEAIQKARENQVLDDESFEVYGNFITDFTNNSARFESPEDMWDYLREYEEATIKSASGRISEDIILAMCSVLRNQLKFEVEVTVFSNIANGIPNARTAGLNCILGIKLSCWGQSIGTALITAAAATVGTLITGPAASAIVISNLINAGAAAATTSFIKSSLSAYQNDSCGCQGSAPTCSPFTGVRLVIMDCSNTQIWQMVGGGDLSTTTRQYVVQTGASFPDYNNSNNTGPISAKAVKITQNTTGNVVLDATVWCSTPSTLRNEYNVNSIRDGVNNIVFKGASSVPVGDTQRYYVYSTGNAANSNLSYTFYVNFAGQIVKTGPDYFDVKWNIKLTTPPYGIVYCNVANSCSGAISYKSQTVSIY